MHKNKCRSLVQYLHDRTDYAKSPAKNENGQLISSYECAPQSIDAEFLYSKRQYGVIIGREFKNDVIAYQIRQSFKPGYVWEIAELKTHIINYTRTREVYHEYKKSGYSKKYLAAHEGEIILHQAAKKTFNEMG